LSSGGVFFGGSYCAPLGAAVDAGQTTPDGGQTTPDSGQTTPDGGQTTPDSGIGCTPEVMCDGLDDDNDGVADEGCPCLVVLDGGPNEGVCSDVVIDCDGLCPTPDNYEVDETTCDGLDNDCDGEVDELPPLDATSVTAGDAHTCALTPDGTAYCWGSNSHGQLGTGTTEDAAQPRRVLAPVPLESISAGAAHTCGIGVDSGAIYCWGRNDARQVANVADPALATPRRIEPRGSERWAAVAAGDDFTCALSGGQAFCWGANDLGQAGQPASDAADSPTLVTIMSGDPFDRIAAGAEHACAWTFDTTTGWCWGNPADGRMFRSDTSGTAPAALPLASLRIRLREVGAGTNHTCALVAQTNADGMEMTTVLCAGANDTLQLSSTNAAAGPTPFDTMQTSATRVVSGNGFTCSSDFSSVTCWGANSFGQAVPPATDGAIPPTSLGEPGLIRAVTGLAAGAQHTCGIDSGTIYCWGDNSSGQLGSPEAVPDMIAQVACGY
jgi:alpha-tubulin suppressor-like RCC1 family protein